MSNRSFYLRSVLCILLMVAFARRAHAQFHLVKDFEKTPTSSAYSYAAPKVLTVGPYLYFTGSDNLHGTELWRTDGTPEGTILLKDINEGPDGSYSHDFVNVDGTVFFIATSSTYGQELWKTDGTPEGTMMVKDISEGNASSQFNSPMVAYAGKLYFVLELFTTRQLWTSDGSEQGTFLVKEIPGILDLTVSGGSLYFSAYMNSSEQELWKSDGTAGNTAVLKDIGPGVGSTPRGLIDVNGILYFRASTQAEGSELWKTDGTANGTVLVKDIRLGQAHSDPEGFVSTNGKLYFLADDGINGRELWVSTPTATTMVKNIGPASAPSYIATSTMAAHNGTVFFEGNDGVHGAELWKSDGTATGTSMVADLVPADGSSYPRDLTFTNGHMYFVAEGGDYGRELWKTDGASVQLVKDLAQGPASSDLLRPAAAGNRICFWVDDGVHGTELWYTDGQNTSLLKDIALGNDWTYIDDMKVIHGTVYFVNDSHGLQKTDGTEAGTVIIEPPLGSGIYYNDLKETTGGFYYVTRDANTNPQRYRIYKTTGQVGAGVAITGEFTSIRYLNEMNGILYFVGDDGTHGEELWKTNGTPGTEAMVKDIYPGAPSGRPYDFRVYKNALYFAATDATHGTELWRCEGGTELGTTMVKDIYPGLTWSSVSGLTEAGGVLYFVANASGVGQELWKTDGTENGTVMVKDIYPGLFSSSPQLLTAADNTLYFVAANEDHGYELWRSNGTAETTEMVIDLFPGPARTNIPYPLIPMNGMLYFGGTDGVNGRELWKTDGTAEGTTMVKDIVPGSFGSSPGGFFIHDGHLFFEAAGQLWKTDGDACTTFAITDVDGFSFADIAYPVAVGNKLFLGGVTEEMGGELYYYDFSTINTPGCTQTVDMEAIDQKTFGNEPFAITATSSSGLGVTFTSSNPEVATISGNTVTILGAGDVTFTATQAGDNRYAPASTQMTITINKATALLALAGATRAYTGSPLNPDVQTTPPSLDGLHFAYTQNGTSVDAVTPGEYGVEVTLDNRNYEAAPVTGTFTITKGVQIITFAELPSRILGEASFQLTATSNSGLPITYASSNAGVASVTGNSVTLTGAGETTITATQNGSDLYEAATPATQILVVELITETEHTIYRTIKIYPNPVADYLLVEGDVLKEGTQLQLRNAEGKGMTVKENHTPGNYTLDLRALSPGVYYLTIRNGSILTTHRIVKK